MNDPLVLDNQAPIKIFQSRKNYNPWLSDETKAQIKERENLKKKSLLKMAKKKHLLNIRNLEI